MSFIASACLCELDYRERQIERQTDTQIEIARRLLEEIMEDKVRKYCIFSEPQYPEPPPAAAELRRGGDGGRAGAPAPRMGDGQGPQRADLLHEPYHQNHTVGGPKKGQTSNMFIFYFRTF